MADPIAMERWRRQFASCCGKVATKPLPLTGIDKHYLEEKSEAEQAKEFWDALTDSFRK
jgi:hypothetical protein